VAGVEYIKDLVERPINKQIEKRLKTEVEKQIAGFIDCNVEKMVNLLCATLPEKPVDIQLSIEATNITIEYAEKDLWQKPHTLLTMNGNYPVSRQFNTGYGHNGSWLAKANKADFEVNLQASGKLNEIDFSQSKLCIEVNIYSVSFDFSVHGKMKY